MGTTNILDLNNRVDEMEKSYPASQVMLSDGVTSVEDALDEVKSGLTNLIKSNTITLTTASTGHASTPIPDTVKVLHVISNGAPCVAFTFNGFWYFAVLTWDSSTLTLALKPSAETTFTYYYI